MSALATVNFYKFIRLDGLPELRDALRAAALGLGIRGTILLAPEGINAGVCGDPAAVDAFVAVVRADARFADIAPKHSYGAVAPYERLLVKVKRWIIRFAEGDDPPVEAVQGGDRMSPAALNALLAAPRDDVILVDTRNRYEVDFGSFRGAESLPIDNFSEFPAAFEAAYGDRKDKTFVFFCTGGVRCEKTTPWAKARGYDRVFQLDGGILKYFEEFADAGWQGQCFVFDNRWTVDARRTAVRPDAPPASQAEIQLADAAAAKRRTMSPAGSTAEIPSTLLPA